MRILVICGDYWHPAEGIKEGLGAILKTQGDVHFVSEQAEIENETLENYDLLIITKADEIAPDNYLVWKTEKIQQAIYHYVAAGGGLLVCHAGTVSGKNTDIFDQLVGCRFRYHPRDSAVTVAPLKPHPICEGVEAFTEIDEHYWIDILRGDVDIIFSSTSPAQGVVEKYESEPYDNCPVTVYPSGYTRTEGKGRICVLTPGHLLPVWQNKNYEKTIKNAIKWLKFES